MTTRLFGGESVTDVKVRAFIRTTKAMNWLLGLERTPGTNRYFDEYSLLLGAVPGRQPGPMCNAEALMTYLDVFDWNDANAADPLPCIAPEEFVSDLRQLIELIQERGYDGAPYLVSTDSDRIDFTDAVCFLAAAVHNSLLRIELWRDRNLVDSVLEDDAKNVYKECIDWLLDNRVGHPDFSGKRGWGWTGVSGIDRYGKHHLPPQTYFTCSALITLLEAATFNFKLVASRLEEILQSIDEARSLLIDTKVSGDGRVGWVDFIPIPETPGNYPHQSGTQQQDTGEPNLTATQPSIHHSLYVFESFGYMRKNLAEMSNNLTGQAAITAQGILAAVERDYFETLEPAALQTLEQFDLASDRWRGIIRRPGTHLVPRTLNDARGNRYLDGSTLTNICNAFELFTSQIPDSVLRERWLVLWDPLIDAVISTSAGEAGFPSIISLPGMEEGKSYSALYATRAGISILLKYGVQSGPEEVGSALEQIQDRLDQARRALDDANDRLQLLGGAGAGAITMGTYAQAFSFAEALEEYRRTVLELCDERQVGLFMRPPEVPREEMNWNLTRENCLDAVSNYRKVLLAAAQTETVGDFVHAIDPGEWDGRYCPDFAFQAIEAIKQSAQEKPEQVLQHRLRFLLLYQHLRGVNDQLRKRLGRGSET